MLIYEDKLDGNQQQYAAIDEAIRIVQFIRNKCLRKWMDGRGISRNDMQCYCAVLAKEYLFAAFLNSQARQASADRAWFAISRFYDKAGQRNQARKATPDINTIIGAWSTNKRAGNWNQTESTSPSQMGAGFDASADRESRHQNDFPTNKSSVSGLCAALMATTASSQSRQNARLTHTHRQAGWYRCGVKSLLYGFRWQHGKESAPPPQSGEVQKLAASPFTQTKESHQPQESQKRPGQSVSKSPRQREDFARKTASTLVTSHDLVAYEDLKICNMVKNHHLAKTIHDAGW